MERIILVGTVSGKAPGLHGVEPDIEELKLRIEQGYRFVAYSVDIRILDCSCRAALQKFTI